MTASEIIALMRQILEIDDIESDDNFFDIGGNSFLALSLIADLEAACGVPIGLIDLIRAPTARQIAGLLARADRNGAQT